MEGRSEFIYNIVIFSIVMAAIVGVIFVVLDFASKSFPDAKYSAYENKMTEITILSSQLKYSQIPQEKTILTQKIIEIEKSL